MGEDIYIDLEVLATIGNDYLIRVSKPDLNTLVSFAEELVVRHWDGTKPVVLEAYGAFAVRTREDASEENNLANLPSLPKGSLEAILG
jgi:hypothetical protein